MRRALTSRMCRIQILAILAVLLAMPDAAWARMNCGLCAKKTTGACNGRYGVPCCDNGKWYLRCGGTQVCNCNHYDCPHGTTCDHCSKGRSGCYGRAGCGCSGDGCACQSARCKKANPLCGGQGGCCTGSPCRCCKLTKPCGGGTLSCGCVYFFVFLCGCTVRECSTTSASPCSNNCL